MSDMPISRRGVLWAGAAIAAGVVLGGVGRAVAQDADLLRPPGAAPESEFMSLCVRCERCTSVCPTDVIVSAPVEAGLREARTPVIDYTHDCCTFCGKCTLVCPTQAIRASDPYDLSSRIGIAFVHEDQCLAFIQEGSCGKCVQACRYGALSFDEQRRPVVDSSRCNGCGECQKVCPAATLMSFSGNSYRGIEVLTEATFAAKEVSRA